MEFRVVGEKVTAALLLLNQAHDWQEQIFDQLTASWSEKQRRDFQQSMTALLDRSYELNA